MPVFTPVSSPKDKVSERKLLKKCSSCREKLSHSQFKCTYGSKNDSPGVFRNNTCRTCERKTVFPKISLYELNEKVAILEDEIDLLRKDISELYSLHEKRK